MELKFWKSSKKLPKNKLAFVGGTYSLIMVSIVLAILIVINIFASVLPSDLTKFDMSSSKLYSVTSNTKVVVNALSEDVTIYWVVQAGEEDDVIENLLNKYKSLSDHIKVEKKNPDIYPTFTSEYTSETVQNNSLIVECGNKNRYIALSDIYIEETDMSSYSSKSYFDGEGAITSAIDYVISEELPRLYTIEGHGEKDLPQKFSDQIEKENIETQSFSLLDSKEVSENADCVMIYSPQTDISSDEKDILASYVKNGGKLIIMSGPTENEPLTNLNDILGDYGLEVVDGVIVEENTDYYALSYPYLLMPNMESDDITNSLIEEKYRVIMPITQGVVQNSSTSDAIVKGILKTSDSSFSKKDGYSMSTFEKEDGDTEGPFAVGVTIDTTNDGKIVWFGSDRFLEEQYNAFSSGGNINIAINALSSMFGEREAMAIGSKSLNYNYLTISSEQASTLKFYLIWAFPVIYFAFGLFVIIVRRRKQNAKK